jgi:two-component system, LytTR family, sensor kinase
MKNNTPFIPFKYFLIGNLLYWVVLSSAYLLQNYAYASNMGRKFMWAEQLSYMIPEHFFSFLLCNGIFFTFILSRNSQWQTFFKIHFLSAVLYGLIHISLSMSTMVWLRMQLGILKEPYLQGLRKVLSSTYVFALNGFLNYWFWIVGLLAIDFYLKFRQQQLKSLELESRLTRSQLQALKMQLQPHFLFNALHTIAMMVRRQKNEEAVEMISGLSDLLRNTLTNSSEQLVTLADELKLLKKYLYIEQVRFKDKFKVEYCIQPETLKVEIPNLLLQPIVENAFKYGISKSLSNAYLRIESQLEAKNLIIKVFNTGSFLDDLWKIEENQGVGLNNTLARLQQLYGNESEFSIHNLDNQVEGVEVKIKIPCN